MERERVFRNDFTPLNKPYSFNGGEKAIVLEVRKPDIQILVKKKSYTIPYREFIIITKRKN